MTAKPVSIPTKKLARNLLATDMTFQLSDIKGWDGSNLSASNFGDEAWGVFRNEQNTIVEFFRWDPSTIANSSITITHRGLKPSGEPTTEITANKKNWTKNVTSVELGTDSPQFLQYLITTFENAVVSGGVDASTSTKGIGKISVTPVSPSNPIFVGDNDPRVPDADPDTLYMKDAETTSASTIVTQTDSTNTIECGEADLTSKKNRLAQRFTNTKTAIKSLTLYKKANSGTFTGSVTFALYANDGLNNPTGAALGSVTMNNATYNALSNNAEFTVDFSSEITGLTPNTDLHLQITTSTSDTTNKPNFGGITSGGSGKLKYYNSVDSWVQMNNSDLYFKVWEGVKSKILKSNSSGKIPESFIPVNYLKTAVRSSGTFTRSSRAASGTVNIPHGLGVIPTKVKFTGFCISNNDTGSLSGVFDSSGQRCLTILDAEGGSSSLSSGLNNASSNAIFISSSSGSSVNFAEYNACVVSVDATNIICSWTFNDNSYTAITWTILWEAEGNTI